MGGALFRLEFRGGNATIGILLNRKFFRSYTSSVHKDAEGTGIHGLALGLFVLIILILARSRYGSRHQQEPRDSDYPRRSILHVRTPHPQYASMPAAKWRGCHPIVSPRLLIVSSATSSTSLPPVAMRTAAFR